MKKECMCKVLDETHSCGFTEICTLCQVDTALVRELVNEGVLTPEGNSPANWRFNSVAIKRIQVVVRLQHDLRVNLPGAALVLDLLEELEELRSQLNRRIP